jgi:hypothetical protein
MPADPVGRAGRYLRRRCWLYIGPRSSRHGRFLTPLAHVLNDYAFDHLGRSGWIEAAE